MLGSNIVQLTKTYQLNGWTYQKNSIWEFYLVLAHQPFYGPEMKFSLWNQNPEFWRMSWFLESNSPFPIIIWGKSQIPLATTGWLTQSNTIKDPSTSDALLLKQMPKKQTGFVLLLKQNKSDLVFYYRN